MTWSRGGSFDTGVVCEEHYALVPLTESRREGIASQLISAITLLVCETCGSIHTSDGVLTSIHLCTRHAALWLRVTTGAYLSPDGTFRRAAICCETYGKAFKRKYDHIYDPRSHSGKQTCTCDQCGKLYTDRSTLAADRRTHINSPINERHNLTTIAENPLRQISQSPETACPTAVSDHTYVVDAAGATKTLKRHTSTARALTKT